MTDLVRRVVARLGALPRRRRVAAVLAVAVALLAANAPDGTDAVRTAAVTSSTVARATTTTDSPTTTASTTTTAVEAPDGGSRAATAELAEGPVDDAFGRGAVAHDDLALLESLAVAPEAGADSYARALFPHWDDRDRDGCDTRCEVLTSQRQADGGWFSEWDGATEHDPSLVHVDHVVALAEAWRSGADAWPTERRDEFADDRANLLAVTAAANLRKGDRDAASWFPSRYEANCLWARTVVVVKASWQLSVDPDERDALANLLASCGAVPPSTTTSTTEPAPQASGGPAPAGGCTPGYDPCLPPAEDYDCASGSGNGPAYTDRVAVDHAHGDPYDLDRDGDGVGCD